MLVSVNIPVTDIQRSQRFYESLVGRHLGKHAFADDALSISTASESFALTMFPKHDPKETTVCYFQVPALGQAIEHLKDLGGTVLVEPFAVTFENRGRSQTRQVAIMSDPDGNGLGLVAQP